jgi:hypothetical protein
LYADIAVRYAEIAPVPRYAVAFITKYQDRLLLEDEPDHQELCNGEQRYFLDAIRNDNDLTDHVEDAVNSLRIAFACDESVRTGKVVML